jgi:hypothetical protein
MSDRSANDKYYDSADDAAKQDESARDPDALRDQDLDQAAGGMFRKTGGDAAADSFAKNDKPESDRMAL